MKLVWLLFGGALGTLSRFWLSHAVQGPLGARLAGFPVGTLAVNVAGCYLLGLFVAGADKWAWGANPRVFAMAGFCGAFTTFSAIVAETSGLGRGGAVGGAFLNIALSLALGYAFFVAGAMTGRAL